MIDSIKIQDKVYEEIRHTFDASYISSLDDESAKDLMLDISSRFSTACLFLDKSDVDSLIDFLKIVRSKMGA